MFTIGNVATGAPGSNVEVTISGTAPNYVLNFTIPQGPTGPQGETGAAGATGETGPTGPTARCNKSSIYIFKW